MKAFIGITDRDWYDFLSRRPDLDEVNFWQPSGSVSFRALQLGQPFLFKLHWPNNFIVGGGFFTQFSKLPVSLAWEAFGEKNGAGSYTEMRRRIEKYRKLRSPSREDYVIGNIILVEPFFLPKRYWIPAPADFSKNIVRGKGYDLNKGVGEGLWDAVAQARAGARQQVAGPQAPMYGPETTTRLRLGQGAFRVMVTEAYHRRCAVTAEKVLPTLQAAHIRPVSEGGGHRLDNGLLLRSDVHTLFDRGYVTVTPDHTFRASRRLRDDFDNGEFYFGLAGRRIEIPDQDSDRPRREFLEWHSDTVFLR